jgi:hypothetical protein
MSADRPQKISFAEMRDMGVRGILIYCADYLTQATDQTTSGIRGTT